MNTHRIPPLRSCLLRLSLAAALCLGTLACSTPAPNTEPEATTRGPLAQPPEPATDTPTKEAIEATSAAADDAIEADALDAPDAPDAPGPGHDMRQRSNEQIDEVPLEKRPAGVDCDRCAHVMIGTQGGSKHRCLRANPERASDPDAPKRVSCDDLCCPDME